MADDWSLHWFRRDLRITGNPALREAWKRTPGRVLGIFCFDPKFLSRPDFSVNRFGFFLKTLKELKREFEEMGGDLLVLDHGPQAAFPKLIESLKKHKVSLPSCVSWNRDYEPFARERDQWAEQYFSRELGIPVLTERDHLFFEPGEIVKDSDREKPYYTVYSPFAKKWFDALHSSLGAKRLEEQKAAFSRRGSKVFVLRWSDLLKSQGSTRDCLEKYLGEVLPQVSVPLPEAGSKAAVQVLDRFADQVEEYLEQRDLPAVAGTSRLSVYLKNGSITSSQIIARLGLGREKFAAKRGPTQFVKEIAWREFYYHILWHRPDVEQQAFLPAYRELKWKNDPKWFELWKQGRTGYPIVDAGMRELAQTGWMHNRVRMIVASFLTKDLLIDWRWGELYFMEALLDGDLAPNNGGWQWAASTGCDPQPYFRIFNPELQSKKFDPEGAYIRKFLPELRQIKDNKRIHAPPDELRGEYPKPLVDHSVQRMRALVLYQGSRS